MNNDTASPKAQVLNLLSQLSPFIRSIKSFKYKSINVSNKDYEKCKEVAAELNIMGYRKTSSKYACISRIDRVDWKEYMVKLNNFSDADFYRRVHSKDRIENIPYFVFKFIKSSGDSED